MLTQETEKLSYHSGCGRFIMGNEEKPVQEFTVQRGKPAGIMIHLHCSGCGKEIPEQDVFDVTGYRPGPLGQDEVSFVCPLCGAQSTSLRAGMKEPDGVCQTDG